MSSESKDVLNYLNEHFILTEISPYKLNTVFYNFATLKRIKLKKSILVKFSHSSIVFNVQKRLKSIFL